MENNRPTICVFCGSSHGSDASYAVAARRFGALIAERGYGLVYGGGGVGLMREVAVAARRGGAPVTGVIPDFLHKQVGTTDRALVSEVVVTASMHERKQRMFEIADAFVVLPGGIGTLEEAVEMLTWAQLDLHTKPIVIINVRGYWDDFIACLEKMIRVQFAQPSLLKMLRVVGTPEEAFDQLRSPRS